MSEHREGSSQITQRPAPPAPIRGGVQGELFPYFRRTSPRTRGRAHIAIANALRIGSAPGWWWSHIPSGEQRNEQTNRLFARMGVSAGMFDFLLIDFSGRAHWLELKRRGEQLTPAQVDFRAMLQKRAIPHAVAYSHAEAVHLLKLWGALE